MNVAPQLGLSFRLSFSLYLPASTSASTLDLALAPHPQPLILSLKTLTSTLTRPTRPSCSPPARSAAWLHTASTRTKPSPAEAARAAVAAVAAVVAVGVAVGRLRVRVTIAFGQAAAAMGAAGTGMRPWSRLWTHLLQVNDPSRASCAMCLLVSMPACFLQHVQQQPSRLPCESQATTNAEPCLPCAGGGACALQYCTAQHPRVRLASAL